MCFRKQRRPYTVVIHLNGRHPYLAGNELDYETRDVTLTVPAKSWNDAAKVAMESARAIRDTWGYSVKSIARAA